MISRSNYRQDNRPMFICSQVGGKLSLNYNLGAKDISIDDLTTKVNDGKYHVVRFSRTGANSSLQIDDKPILHKFTQGELDRVEC